MEIPHEMTTITHIMEKMRSRGIDCEFKMTPLGQLSSGKGKSYSPEDLEIVRIFRFEGITDPGDMSILYIIQANDGLIGYRLDPYGAYSNAENGPEYDNFMRMVRTRGHEDQLLFEL